MEDAVPLTPMVVDCVTFDRAPLGRRGYNEDQVDEYLDRIQAALAGTDTLTAQEVREVVFDAAPLIRRGYHEDQVDDFLDLVVDELDNRERTKTATRPAKTPRPATRAGAPTDPSEQTSPALPVVQPGPALRPATASTNPSLPLATRSNPSFPPAAAQPDHSANSPTTPRPPIPGRGPLALPLPPTPPDERGYHPAEVARLVALLSDAAEPPSSAAITDIRMNRMDVGQGYHAGAVDAMRAIWITELRRRGL